MIRNNSTVQHWV